MDSRNPTSPAVLWKWFKLNTTAHGIPHITRSKGFIKKSQWLVCTGVCVLGFLYNLSMLIHSYLQYNVLTKVLINSNRTLEFPAVTLCNTNPIKSSKVTEDPKLTALLKSWGIHPEETPHTRRKRADVTSDNNTHSVNRSLILTANGINHLTVYFDGIQSNLTPASGFTSLDVPYHTEVVTFEVKVTEASYGGFIASYSNRLWNTGDGSFVCTTDPGLALEGWMSLDFDASGWQVPIRIVKSTDVYKNEIAANYVGSDAWWVWADARYSSAMYCRHVLCNNSELLTVQVDDQAEVYASGIRLGETKDHASMVKTRVPCNTNSLAIKGHNLNGGGGLLAVYEGHWESGDGSLLCTNDLSKVNSGWKNYGYDTSGWKQPKKYLNNSLGWRYEEVHKAFPTAWWVWADNKDDKNLCCRLKENYDFGNQSQPDIWSGYLNPSSESQQVTTANYSHPTNPHSCEGNFCYTTSPIDKHSTDTSAQYGLDSNMDNDRTPSQNDVLLPKGIHAIHYEFDMTEELPTGLRRDFSQQTQLLQVLSELDDEYKKELGYTLQDMIVQCSFDGKDCTQDDFSWFFDGVHGNCYTFNSGWNATNTQKYTTRKPGTKYGLEVIMDIGQYEYLPVINQAAGAVVVVHPQTKMPFPQDEGIYLLPGKAVSLGVKLETIFRQPHPYGECLEEVSTFRSRDVYEELYPVSYRTQGCMKTCYQHHVVKRCGCGDPQYPLSGAALGGNHQPCDVYNLTQNNCAEEVKHRFIHRNLSCDCPETCHDLFYKYSISSLIWPAENYKDDIGRAILSSVDFLDVEDLVDFEKNILAVQVYYDELDYKRIEERPAYSLTSLFTDIAGILGLWVGCSLFSLAEFVELGYDCVVLYINRVVQRGNRQSIRSKNRIGPANRKNENSNGQDSSGHNTMKVEEINLEMDISDITFN